MRTQIVRKLNTLRFAQVLLVAAGMLGLCTQANAGDVLRVGKAVPEAFSFVPLDVGMQTGIFEKYALEIQPAAFAGDAKLHQAMTADGIDIALGSGPAMAFIAKGSPDKAIAALAGPPLLLAIVVRPDGAKTIADLKGKKVGVSTAGSLTAWLVSETARRQGWGPKGIDIEPLGAMPGQIAALKRGDIDGVIMDVGTAFNLEKSGSGRILVRFTDIKDFMINVIYATNKDIDGRPNDLRKFLKGWFETIVFMRAHKAETIKIAAPVIGQEPDITARTYDELMPMFSDDGKFSPRALAVLSKSWVDLGVLQSEPDVATLYTEEFVPK